jgi:hypothetical protein
VRFDSTHVGQAEIEDDHVGLHVGGGAEPSRAGIRLLYGIAVQLKPGADEPPDLRFIVDDQHGVS